MNDNGGLYIKNITETSVLHVYPVVGNPTLTPAQPELTLTPKQEVVKSAGPTQLRLPDGSVLVPPGGTVSSSTTDNSGFWLEMAIDGQATAAVLSAATLYEWSEKKVADLLTPRQVKLRDSIVECAQTTKTAVNKNAELWSFNTVKAVAACGSLYREIRKYSPNPPATPSAMADEAVRAGQGKLSQAATWLQRLSKVSPRG